MPTSHFFAFHWLYWLLAQAWFCGRTHLSLSPNWTTSTVQVIFRYLRPDAPVFNLHRIQSTCGHGDISAITLLILSLSGCSCLNILWYTTPVDMMTFRWSHRSNQSICQQLPPYSHPQVTLIYYTLRAKDFQGVCDWKIITDYWWVFKQDDPVDKVNPTNYLFLGLVMFHIKSVCYCILNPLHCVFVGCYGILTLVSYLMPTLSYLMFIQIYIRYLWFLNELFVGNILKKPKLICLHTVEWFQVLISGPDNSI